MHRKLVISWTRAAKAAELPKSHSHATGRWMHRSQRRRDVTRRGMHTLVAECVQRRRVTAVMPPAHCVRRAHRCEGHATVARRGLVTQSSKSSTIMTLAADAVVVRQAAVMRVPGARRPHMIFR